MMPGFRSLGAVSPLARIQYPGVKSMNLFSFAPPEARNDTPRVVLSGQEEALIEQHRGLFSYESRCVRVRVKEGVLAVTGENLLISHFGAQDLVIRGKIAGVTLEEL